MSNKLKQLKTNTNCENYGLLPVFEFAEALEVVAGVPGELVVLVDAADQRAEQL